MAAPTSYTEATLKTFIHTTLGEVATALGWSDSGDDYAEAVNETLLAYGVDDIADVTGRDNIRKLRVLARLQAWQKVVNATAGDYDFKADGASFNRSQVHAQAMKNLEAAQAVAWAFDPDYVVGVDKVVHKHDPYVYVPDEERTP